MRILIYLLVVITYISGCSKHQKKRDNNISKNPANCTELVYEKLNEEKTSTIPSTLIAYISNEMKEYSVPNIKEYISGFNEYTESQEFPYFTSSDFNGDSNVDYAIVLKNNKKGLTLFIFQYLNKEYSYLQLDDYSINTKGIDIVLSIEPKGKWEAITETITTRNDGVLVEMIYESLSSAYYWNGKEYVRFLYN